MKRSQTATEYLIILAVVIVIAIVVVSVLGGIPRLGGGSDRRSREIEMRTDDIGVISYATTGIEAIVEIKNNLPHSVRVTQFTFDSLVCNEVNTVGLPVFLNIGESKLIRCFGTFNDYSNRREIPFIGFAYTSADASLTTPLYEEVLDFTSFTSIVIDTKRGYIWQAGSSPTEIAWATG